MSTITKEWLLKTIAELEEERDAVPGAVNEDAAMALAAMNLALASLEAEPMAFIGQRMLEELTDGSRSCGRVWSEVTDKLSDENRIPLYTAPPAPASVPDAIHSQGEKSVGDDYYALGWNACRAAMLQGAEPVKTANKLPFEQWLSQQTGTIDVECGCVMTEVFFHWLRVAYEAGNTPVIPDGWVACSERLPEQFVEVLVCTEGGSRYVAALNQSMNWDDGDFFDDIQYVTHWMPLPAAPQQEVK